MSYYVYVLKSEKVEGKHYVGMTSNIERRLKEHNAGRSKFTSGFIPWKIVYSEFLATRSEAREREKYLKSAAGRRFIKQYLLRI
ncbi:MAG: GIY-YIG nuclease family protein [Cyclobacteriaceae bacterium]